MTADLDDLREGLAEALWNERFPQCGSWSNAKATLAFERTSASWPSDAVGLVRRQADWLLAGPLAPLIAKAESADAYALVLADCVAALAQVPLGLLPGCVDMMVVSALGAPLPGDRARAEIIAAADRIRAAANARADRLAADVETLRAALGEAEACLSIVEPRSDRSEYMRTLGVIRTALAADKADKPEGSR